MSSGKDAPKSKPKRNRSGGARKAAPKRGKAASASAAPAPAAQESVRPDLTNPYLDANVPIGGFARVVSGEHEGRYGVVLGVAELADDGTPKSVVFQTRDADDLRLEINYSDLERDEPGKR